MELSLLASIIVVPSAVIAICQWAHARFARLRRAPGDGASINGRHRVIALNGVDAMAVYFSSVVLGGGWLIDAGRASRWYMPVLALLLFVERLLVAMGYPPMRKRVPYWIAYAGAGLVEAAHWVARRERTSEDGVSRFAVRYLNSHHYYRIDKAIRDLHWRPRIALAEAIQLTAKLS